MVWQDFESLVRDICFRVMGAGVGAFKAGPDGGRDARFEGTPISWPSRQEQEEGKYVIQAKHASTADACCSRDNFRRQVGKEVPKVKALVAAEELTHYLLFTNRTKPAGEDESFRKRFCRIKGLKQPWLVGSEELTHLLREHSDIWDRYEMDVRAPTRFSRDDLVELIEGFAQFVRRRRDQPRTETLKHLKLSDKNRVNSLSEEYFSDLQRHTMPQFEHIRTFLENPRNVNNLNLYRDTADELRGQLRMMLSRGEVASLEEGMDTIRAGFIASEDRFKLKRRWVRIFIDYMYATCEIGKNVDAP